VHFLGPQILTAGVLLFDDTPQASLPTKCAVKVTRLETARGSTSVSISRVHLRRLRGRYEALRYPPVAIHEIITNAVIHRDYGIKDDIHINIYDNRIEVISPGRLPGTSRLRTYSKNATHVIQRLSDCSTSCPIPEQGHW